MLLSGSYNGPIHSLYDQPAHPSRIGVSIRTESFKIVPARVFLMVVPPIADFGQTVTLSLRVGGPNQVIWGLLGKHSFQSGYERCGQSANDVAVPTTTMTRKMGSMMAMVVIEAR